MPTEKPKRKTHTSTEVKRRYNEKVYSQVAVRQKKELVTQWEEKLKQDGITKAEFIRKAIEQYLSSPPE